jgi:hypothetical protein
MPHAVVQCGGDAACSHTPDLPLLCASWSAQKVLSNPSAVEDQDVRLLDSFANDKQGNKPLGSVSQVRGAAPPTAPAPSRASLLVL